MFLWRKHVVFLKIFLLCLGVWIFALWQNQTARYLRVHFLDVGQGDAIFIQTPYGQDILIDEGPDNSVVYRLGRLMPFWDHKIDVVIMTHLDADHMMGLVEVLNRYQVGEVLWNGIPDHSPEYAEARAVIDDQHIPFKAVAEGDIFSFGPDLHLFILNPAQGQALDPRSAKDQNNASVVARLVYGQRTFLFTADLEKRGESRLLQKRALLSADILKVGHHGSKTSTSAEFLAQVRPETGVISVGKDNRYGHPHESTLFRLQRQGVKIYRTDQDGGLEVKSDGKQLWMMKE